MMNNGIQGPIIFNIIAYSITFSAMAYYLHNIWSNKSQGELIRYYSVMHITTMVYLVFDLLPKLTLDLEIRYFLLSTGFVVFLIFSVTFFNFGYYNYFQKKLSRSTFFLLMLFPFLGLSLSVTNKYHSLFIQEIYSTSQKWGLLFYIFMGIQTILVFYAIILNLRATDGSVKNVMPSKIILFCVGGTFFIAYFLNCDIIYLPIDAEPLMILPLFTFTYRATYKLGLFDIIAPQVVKSIEMYEELLMLCDAEGKLLYNNSAIATYSEKEFSMITDKAKEMILDMQGRRAGRKPIMFCIGERWLSLSVHPITNKRSKIQGYVCVVHDDSDLITAINDLKSKNEQLEEMNRSVMELAENRIKLAALEERNRLAKDIHDVLGHALVIAHQTIESNRLIIDEDSEKALQRLFRAAKDIEAGLDEIASSKEDKTKKELYTSFYHELSRMVQRTGEVGVKIDITAVERLYNCTEEQFHVMLRICQEAVTNAIKHGNAKQILISMKRMENTIVLRIVDDGKGVHKVIKGNGLNGMEARISALKGKISFGGFEGGIGFMVYGRIPI